MSELTQEKPRGNEPPSSTLDRLLRPQLSGLKRFVRAQTGPMLRAQEAVSDLMQSVCRELVERWEPTREPDHDGLRKWLFHLTKRKIVERLRYYGREKRQPLRPLDDGGSTASDGSAVPDLKSSTPSEAAIDRERHERIEKAMLLLPTEYREVIVLARQEELSHAQIGERLGRSEMAVRKLLSRAMARLVLLTRGA